MTWNVSIYEKCSRCTENSIWFVILIYVWFGIELSLYGSFMLSKRICVVKPLSTSEAKQLCFEWASWN